MSRRNLLPLLLAVTALVSSVALALVPPSFERSEILWEPQNSLDNGSLPLTRTTPDRFEVSTTCDAVRAGEDGTLLTAGTFLMMLTGGTLEVTTTAGAEPAKVWVPPGSCDVDASFDASSSTLELTVGDESATVTAQPPSIDALTVEYTSRIQTVRILTQPTGLRWSWTRGILVMFVLATAAMATVLLLRYQRERPPTGRRRFRLPSLAPVDAAVAVVLLALTPLIPALIDDGWILARVEKLYESHWFGNVYSISDAWLPQGLLHEALLGGLEALGADFIHLRLATALCLVIAWLVLRTRVLSPVLGEDASRWPPVAATYVAFAGAWLTTIRAEPVVVLCGVITLAALVSMNRRPGPLPLLVGAIFAGLAVATHQTGWVCLGPFVLLLRTALPTKRSLLPTLWGSGAALSVAVAVTMVALFAAIDLRTALEGARAFSSGHGYGGVLAELSRYDQAISPAMTSARSFTVLLLLGLALMATTRLADADVAERRLWQVAVLWVAGLVLTSSKWPWHLGVYVVPATIFAALIAVAVRRRGLDGQPGMALLLPLLVFFAGLTLVRSGTWGSADLSARSWAEFQEFFVDGRVQGACLAAVLLALIGGMLFDRGRLRRTASTALAVVVLFPLTANLVWIGLDVREQGWSFAGMNVRHLVGTNDCGRLAEASITVGARPLQIDRKEPRDATQVLTEDGFAHQPGTTVGPLAGSVPVWGSWATPVGGTDPNATTGRLSGPVYSTGEAAELTLWSLAGTDYALSAELVFSDSDGPIERVPIPLSPEPRWTLHTVAVPAQAASAQVVIEDATGGFGGWAAVSAPTIAEEEPATSAFAAARGFVGPYEYTGYPCLRLPDLSEGYWARSDYLIAGDIYFAAHQYVNLTRSQVSCQPNGTCLEKLDYAMANVSVTRRH